MPVDVDQPVESGRMPSHCLDRFGGGIDADHGVAAAVEQAINGRQKDAAQIVGWDDWAARGCPARRAAPIVLRQRVTLRILRRRERGPCCSSAWRRPPRLLAMMAHCKLLEHRFAGRVIQEEFAEFAHCHAADRERKPA